MQTYTVRMYRNGTNYWYKKGTRDLHREDGPAIEYPNGDRYWYQHGKNHRLNGPAVELIDGTKCWCIDGKNYLEKEYWQKIEELKHSNDCSNKIIEIDGKKYKLIPVD